MTSKAIADLGDNAEAVRTYVGGLPPLKDLIRTGAVAMALPVAVLLFIGNVRFAASLAIGCAAGLLVYIGLYFVVTQTVSFFLAGLGELGDDDGVKQREALRAKSVRRLAFWLIAKYILVFGLLFAVFGFWQLNAWCFLAGFLIEQVAIPLFVLRPAKR